MKKSNCWQLKVAETEILSITLFVVPGSNPSLDRSLSNIVSDILSECKAEGH